jgi:hypothetical protein
MMNVEATSITPGKVVVVGFEVGWMRLSEQLMSQAK